jgi:hypothetical protein
VRLERLGQLKNLMTSSGPNFFMNLIFICCCYQIPKFRSIFKVFIRFVAGNFELVLFSIPLVLFVFMSRQISLLAYTMSTAFFLRYLCFRLTN